MMLCGWKGHHIPTFCLEAMISSSLYAGIKHGTVSSHVTAWNRSHCLLCMYVLCCSVVSENRFWHVLCVPQWAARCKSCRCLEHFTYFRHTLVTRRFAPFVALWARHIFVFFWCSLFALVKFLFADLLTRLRSCTICTCFALTLCEQP